MHNLNYAQNNLRWCLRVWRAGEMKELSLFLFRKAIAQLTLEDMTEEGITEVLYAHLSREVCNDLDRYNKDVMNNSVLYAAWEEKVRSLFIC